MVFLPGNFMHTDNSCADETLRNMAMVPWSFGSWLLLMGSIGQALRKTHKNKVGLWRLAWWWKKAVDSSLWKALKAPHLHRRRNHVCHVLFVLSTPVKATSKPTVSFCCHPPMVNLRGLPVFLQNKYSIARFGILLVCNSLGRLSFLSSIQGAENGRHLNIASTVL